MAFAFILVVGLANFMNLKTLYAEALAGKEAAEYSVVLIKEGQYDSARYFSELAKTNFHSAALKIYDYENSALVSRVPYFSGQLRDLAYLLTAADVLSEAMSEVAVFGQGVDSLLNRQDKAFAELSKSEKTAVLKTVYESGPALSAIKDSLRNSLENLDKISYRGLLWPAKNKITTLAESIREADVFLKRVMPATKLLPPLLGYPEKAVYLVLLQNSDELRPTGGFLGTYGILEIDSGDIARFDTHDIYHMDMPVKDIVKITPPEPLVKYLGVDYWYLRDANWSPDWPAAAQKIEWFYHEENRYLTGKDQINNFDGEFSGVIGVCPDFVIDLLSLSGPIRVEGEEYNKDNFMDLLEYRVEQGYVQLGIPSWHRKEVIGDIVKELKQRVFSLSPAELYANLNIAIDNLHKKNILLYFRDENLNELAQAHNWGGELKGTDGDFLMIVDANMASYKTDAVIDRQVVYRVDEGSNGIFADLTVNYAHSGGFDWRTTRYRTYVRVYVPPGSELVSAAGQSEGEVTAQSEYGKTVFSAFVSIEPGNIGSLRLRYRLPDRIGLKIAGGAYDLYCQKQPGTRVSSLEVSLNFLKPVNEYAPVGFYAHKESENRIMWETDWQYDRIFEIEF